MSKLGLLDQFFFKFEQGISPLYMGGATIVDPSTAPNSPDAVTLANHLAAVMEEIPLMRQKVVQDKFRVGSMRLVEDPDFDVKNHIRVTYLSGSAGYDELTEYLGHFSMQRINLDRPLWRFEIIGGLEHGYLAVAMHIHHSILDGVGAGRALGSMWSHKITEPRTPRTGAWAPDPEPSRLSLLGDALSENVRRAMVDTPKFVLNNSRPILSALTKQIGKKLGLQEDSTEETGIVLPPVQKTSINQFLAGKSRVISYVELPLPEMKALRKTYDCTINDLALYINSYAFQHYFDAIGEEVDFDLVSLMPLNTRQEGDASSGTSVALRRVNLHNTVADPKARLAAIVADTQEIKRSASREKTDDEKEAEVDFGALSGLFSPIVLEAVVYAMNRFNLLDKAPAIANMVITNVPGFPVPMYIAGAQAVTSIPFAPIADSMALTVSITSMNDLLLIGFHGCGDVIQDKELFVEGARKGWEAIQSESKARRKPKTPDKSATTTRRKSTTGKNEKSNPGQ